MNMLEAVGSVLTKYAVFYGRARRAEYWWFMLFQAVVGIAAGFLDAAWGTDSVAGGTGTLGLVVTLGLLVPGIAVTVRRLHDTNRSGWFILLGLIPLIGIIVLLVFTVMDGTPGPNRFGLSPKLGAAGYGNASQRGART